MTPSHTSFQVSTSLNCVTSSTNLKNIYFGQRGSSALSGKDSHKHIKYTSEGAFNRIISLSSTIHVLPMTLRLK